METISTLNNCRVVLVQDSGVCFYLQNCTKHVGTKSRFCSAGLFTIYGIPDGAQYLKL